MAYYSFPSRNLIITAIIAIKIGDHTQTATRGAGIDSDLRGNRALSPSRTDGSRGAVCSSAASTDLGGGRRATAVLLATKLTAKLPWQIIGHYFDTKSSRCLRAAMTMFHHSNRLLDSQAKAAGYVNHAGQYTADKSSAKARR